MAISSEQGDIITKILKEKSEQIKSGKSSFNIDTQMAEVAAESRMRNIPPVAIKHDDGKLRYDLLPAVALEELVKVYTYGIREHGERNWENGLSFSRLFAALMRHAWKFWRGETIDDDSGLNHMAHVAWNALALVQFSSLSKYRSFDNRPL